MRNRNLRYDPKTGSYKPRMAGSSGQSSTGQNAAPAIPAGSASGTPVPPPAGPGEASRIESEINSEARRAVTESRAIVPVTVNQVPIDVPQPNPPVEQQPTISQADAVSAVQNAPLYNPELELQPNRAEAPYSQTYEGLPILPEVEYEREPVVRKRRLSRDTFNAYLGEGKSRLAGALGVDPEELTQQQVNRAASITQQQVLEGAPIVPFDPNIPALQVSSNPLKQLWDGAVQGFENQNIVGDYVARTYIPGGQGAASYSRSLVGDLLTDNHAAYLTQDKPLLQKVGVGVGRVAGDIVGQGTRKWFWNMHPEDMTATYGKQAMSRWANASPLLARVTAYGATNALGILSGNHNPLNFAEGGRPAGFEAISEDPDDPRKSTNPATDYLLYRGMFGRGGRVLPWEQFHAERPDVSYETYDNYKQYLREPGFLGLVKGTMDGLDGPEAQVMGYRVTPAGALGAGAVLAGGLYLGRRKR